MTEKNVETLINGLVGLAGAVIGGALTALASLAWRTWSDWKKKHSKIRQLMFRLSNSVSEDAISRVLFDLREHFLENLDLMPDGSPRREFFNEWLKDAGIEINKLHTKFGRLEISKFRISLELDALFDLDHNEGFLDWVEERLLDRLRREDSES